jgi:M6 family metalloprotease-like protein
MSQHKPIYICLSTLVFIVLLILLPMQPVAFGETVKKGIVLLVQFPDVPNNVDRNQVQFRFSRQLNNYVQEMSYHKISLEIDVTKKWYTMPSSISQYRISSRNLEVDRSRIRKIIDDAINAADSEINFSTYDFAVIYMGAKMNEYGMIGLCGYPGMLGWSSADMLKTKSGQQMKNGIAIFSYQAHLGTLFHDVAHILGGVKDGKRMVPCLYDHDLQAKPGPMRETFQAAMINLGYWDPMSCHYKQFGVPPPGICSWTKLRLGWIDPAQVKVVNPSLAGEEVILDPLEQESAKTLVIKIPITSSTYYLIENRQPIGYDQYVPGSGILIMYADDNIAECRHNQSPVKLVNANPSIPNLDGAAFDIGKKVLFEDARNKLRIQIIDKIDNAYKLRISWL